MRIGIDAGKALKARDGIGRHSRELLRALVALDAGIELELFGLPPGSGRAEVRDQLWGSGRPYDGSPVAGREPAFAIRSGWQVEPDSVDLFHATAWKIPPGFAGPLVFTCYDLTFLTHPGCHILDNKVLCLTGVLRANLAGAGFIAISEATASGLRRHFGIEESRISVIYPAQASHLRPIAKREAGCRLRERFGVDGAPVLSVGTLEPRKNLERLLAAYAGLDENLRRRHPLLVTGGGGWKNDRILSLVGELETAHLLGPVDDTDLAVLYSAAAVFAYPSLAEGFGLPVLEAMACGAPVVTSNLSSLPEVAGDAARLVDPYDVEAIRFGLDHLLRDPDECKRLSALGSDRAASFSWQTTARRTVDLYRGLVAAGSEDQC